MGIFGLFSFSNFLKGQWLTLIVMVLTVQPQARSQSKVDISEYPFQPGEKLTYSMSFGWFEVGEGEVYIDPELWLVDHRPHFYVQCQVKTIGFFSFLAKLEVCMDAWIDAETLKPTRAFRDVSFGKRIDIRTDRFFYQDSVYVKAYVEDVDSHREHAFARSDTLLLDALSTYLNLRNIICNKQSPHSVFVKTFFSNDLYTFGMKDAGTVNFYEARKYELVFPVTEDFPERKEAYVLASIDGVCVPLKFFLEMKYGDFTFKLKERNVE